MSVSRLSKAFFRLIDERIGPFDRPFRFHIFPFAAGGSLNFLTVGAATGDEFVTYVSWDLFGSDEQKRGGFGRYELLCFCDEESWCSEVLTMIGRQGLHELIEPNDTFDIGPLVSPDAPIQGVVFEEALRTELRHLFRCEPCGLLRCIGVTRPELEFAMARGTSELIERLRRAGIYPRTIAQRKDSVELGG